MSNLYNSVANNIVNQIWKSFVKDTWPINHDQHKEVLMLNLSDMLFHNIPEIEMVSLSSSEIKDFIFHRNLLDIAEIMELSSRSDLVNQMTVELDLALNIIHSLILGNSPENASELMSKLNDASRYESVLDPIIKFQLKANKINILVTKIMNLIQHAENSKELGIQTSNPSFGSVFTKMASNPRFNQELSLYLKSLSN